MVTDDDCQRVIRREPKVKGFVSGYLLDTEIGQKIARLKGLDIGWHFPTYILQYVRNPGPLLLFDEIVIDHDAADWAVEYMKGTKIDHDDYESRAIISMQPNDSEIEIFQQLIESKLFVRERVARKISDTDFDHIAKGYFRDLKAKSFRNSLSALKRRYGRNYAQPDPERFEAMNINVTTTLLEKFSAKPLDDVLRVPLYEYKATQGLSLGIREVATAYKLIDQARQALFLPSKPIQDIDRFLTLYDDPAIESFRRKVHELSLAEANSQEMKRQVSEANMELRELKISSWNIAISFFGLAAGLTALLAGCFASGNFVNLFHVSGALGLGQGSLSLGKILSKISKTPQFGWLKAIRGLCEAYE